jgi:hypothetical protein
MPLFEEFRIERSHRPYRLAVLCSVLVFLVAFLMHPEKAPDPRSAAMEEAVFAISPLKAKAEYFEGSGITLRADFRSVWEKYPVAHRPEPLPVMLSILPAKVFGAASSRVFYAFSMALLSLLFFAVTMQLFSRLWLGVAVQLLATLNPFMSIWPYFSGDLLAGLVLGGILVLLMGTGSFPVLLGLLFSALLSLRVEALVLLPLAVVRLWSMSHESFGTRVYSLFRFTLAALGFGAAFAWINFFFIGLPTSDPLVLVHLQQGSHTFLHGFMGFTFQWPYPLSFPFVFDLLSAPCMAFPTMLQILLLLLGSLGLLLVSMLVLGVSQLLGEARGRAMLLLFFALACLLFAFSKADFEGPELQRLLLVYPCFWVFIAAGLARFTVIGKLRSNIIKLLLLAFFLAMGVGISRHLEFDVDTRVRGGCSGSGVYCESRGNCGANKSAMTRSSILPRSVVGVRWNPSKSWDDFLADLTRGRRR